MSGLLTGLGILIIGASQFAHNGSLITTLPQDLQQEGASVVAYGACATVPESWLIPRPVTCGSATRIGTGPVVTDGTKAATSWSVVDLIHQYHPNVVIVGIADTLAGYRQPEISRDWVRGQMQALANRIAAEHVGCIWLGTTWGAEGGPLGKNFERVKQLSETMAEDAAPCEYIDSLAFSKPGEWQTTDGQHHTPAVYELWGAAATKAILQTATVRQAKASLGGAPGPRP